MSQSLEMYRSETTVCTIFTFYRIFNATCLEMYRSETTVCTVVV